MCGSVSKPNCGRFANRDVSNVEPSETIERLERLELDLRPKPAVNDHRGELPETINVDEPCLLQPGELLLEIAVVVRPMITARSGGPDFRQVRLAAARSPYNLIEVFFARPSISVL